MKVLLIDNNKLGDQGARLLASCVSSMNLSHLNVGFNEIGAEGITAVLQACLMPIKSTSMSILNISGSVINNEVARLLGDLLSKNRTLTELYMDRTNIGPAGERSIATGIASNRSCALSSFTGFDLGEVLIALGSPACLGTMPNKKALQYLAEMWRAHDSMQAQPETYTGSSNCSTSAEDDDQSVAKMSRQHPTNMSAAHSAEHMHHYELSNVSSLSISNDFHSSESGPEGSSQRAHPMFVAGPSHNSIPMFDAGPSTDASGQASHLQKYMDALQEIAYLPFIPADLWSLHQYYFSPRASTSTSEQKSSSATIDGSTSESEEESPAKSHSRRTKLSERPKKRQSNVRTMARIAGYPRLKILLEKVKSESSESRMLTILRQLKFLEDNADDLNDFDLESALIESL